MLDLHQHWQNTLSALNLDLKAAEIYYQQLLKHYQEAHRHYHNLYHIEALFRHFEEYQNHLESKELVALAIWYHDAIYSSIRKHNEARSAALAEKHLSALKLEPDKVERVKQMIQQTAQHHGPLLNQERDLQWFLDFDLSILGAEAQIYHQYSRQIREEYRLIPEIVYRQGRNKILTQMLKSEFLFYTPVFRKKYEKQARQNILHELRQAKAIEALGLN